MNFPRATTHLDRAAHHRAHGEWPKADLAALFAATCAARGDATAIVDGDARLSFRAWNEKSRLLARRLRALGVRRGSVVAYQLPNWWEGAVVFLAAARLGAVVNPLLPIFRAHELRFILRQSGASVLFLPARFRDIDYPGMVAQLRHELPDLAHVVSLRGRAAGATHSWDDLREPGGAAADGPDTAAEGGDPEDLLLLMYTSGTTSAPKGVLHTHATLISEVHSLERVHGISAEDTTLMPSPLTHISGVLHAILTPALLGTRAVLMERWDPGAALALLAAEQVTYMVGAPTFLQDLIAQAERNAPPPLRLRLFSCGGASVSADLIRAARERLSCLAKRVYGSTEFPTITSTDADDATSMGAECEGRAIAPNQIRVVDAAAAIAESGEEGEVQARGPECFVGYADAALDAAAFTDDGWFRTGDLGRIDRDGYLTITGRLKEIVIRKGEKISIGELEELIAAHPDVREVCVVPVDDRRRGEIACAVVATRSGAGLSLARLADFLRQGGLATQKLPEKLIVLPALPLTDSGKVHRAAVRELATRSGGDEAP